MGGGEEARYPGWGNFILGAGYLQTAPWAILLIQIILNRHRRNRYIFVLHFDGQLEWKYKHEFKMANSIYVYNGHEKKKTCLCEK